MKEKRYDVEGPLSEEQLEKMVTEIQNRVSSQSPEPPSAKNQHHQSYENFDSKSVSFCQSQRKLLPKKVKQAKTPSDAPNQQLACM